VTGKLRVVESGTPIATTYTYSLQTHAGDTCLEILNNAGTNKGAFFCLNGTGVNGDDFNIFNWQGGDIAFYTNTAASAGTLRMTITPAGKVIIADLATTGAAGGKFMVCADASGQLYRSSSTTTCAN